MEKDEWLTVDEAVDLSGYSAVHLRDLLRKGELRGKKFGPSWGVSRVSLLEYLKEAESSRDRRHGPKTQKT